MRLCGSSGLPEIFSHTGSRVNHTEQIRLARLYLSSAYLISSIFTHFNTWPERAHSSGLPKSQRQTLSIASNTLYKTQYNVRFNYKDPFICIFFKKKKKKTVSVLTCENVLSLLPEESSPTSTVPVYYRARDTDTFCIRQKWNQKPQDREQVSLSWHHRALRCCVHKAE